jgi:hypothetical protein
MCKAENQTTQLKMGKRSEWKFLQRSHKSSQEAYEKAQQY